MTTKREKQTKESGDNKRENLLPTITDHVPENPYKEDIFETYITWKTLPALLKNPPPQKRNGAYFKPDAREFAEANGIDDDDLLDLITIPNKFAFAQRFHVRPTTLTQWDRLIEKRNPLQDSKRWASKLIQNLMMSLYSHSMKKGDARAFKLFFQVAGDFEEKASIDHKFIPIETIEYQIIDHESNPQIK